TLNTSHSAVLFGSPTTTSALRPVFHCDASTTSASLALTIEMLLTLSHVLCSGIAPMLFAFFFSSRRRHTRSKRDWSSDVCSSDLDGNGYELLETIRKTSQIPVLLITANDLESDEITGFSLGADDYITKPFSLMALRARVERMRMRTGEGQRETKDTYTDHRYRFLFDQMQFFVDGQEIILSRTEQKLLRTFVWNPGITLSRERLMEILWTDGAKFVEENALSVAVNRLRHKLSGKGDYRPIETVYGIGYVWEKKA